MNKQPVFKKMGLFDNLIHPISEKIAKRGLYLPSGITLKDDQIKYVSEQVLDILNR